MEIVIWGFVLSLIACLIVGVVIGYFVSRKLFQTALKKNPPINRNMVKAMYRSMGQTPSEARVNQTMRAIEEAQRNPSTRHK
ncbi:MAG TPA: YneF family protein [Candidatus Enterosoma merdigallinarum]|nr:YneF family protein [Candidatus Enterosoma merdigallinarum]